jgi:simple sugar transport system permease protein
MDISFFTEAVVAGTPLLFAILGELITEKAGAAEPRWLRVMLMGAVVGLSRLL